MISKIYLRHIIYIFCHQKYIFDILYILDKFMLSSRYYMMSNIYLRHLIYILCHQKYVLDILYILLYILEKFM